MSNGASGVRRRREQLPDPIECHCGLLQTILHNVRSGIALFHGAELRLKWANRKYLEFVRELWGDADVTGWRLEEIVPGANESGLTEIFRQVAIAGEPHFEPEYAYAGIASGITYWQWSLLPLTDGGGDVPNVMLFVTEITEQVLARRRAEQLNAEAERRADELHLAYDELEVRTRELTTLLDISRQVGSTLELQPLLELILDQLKTAIDYTGAAIFIADQAGISIAAYHGPVPQAEVIGFRVPTEGIPQCRQVLQSREPTILDDLYGDTPLAREFRTCAGAGMLRTIGESRAIATIPIVTKERVIGLLRIDHLQPGYFTLRHSQLALAIANQAAVALENARLYREVKKVAALEERARLARELHDSVSQALYGISLGIHAVGEMLDGDPGRVAETLAYVRTLAHGALTDMRSLIFELHPDSLENEGLAAAFAKLSGAVQARYNVDLLLDFCPEDGLSMDVKEAIYRICQEALWNTLKHAKAKRVVVRLVRDQDFVVLELSDDGTGFDTTESIRGHFGLRSMHDRAASLGGTLIVESATGRGTNVRARIPSAAVGRESRDSVPVEDIIPMS